MPFYLADLHIHTALSPCADKTMSPPAIVRRCVEAGLSVVAITDHNSSGNILSVMEAASGLGLVVLPGIEAQTSEDIHIVLLFPGAQACMDFDKSIIRPALPGVRNRPSVFGQQLLMDAGGQVTGELDEMLSASLFMTAAELMKAARKYGALCIAAHADRPAHGYLYTMGMVAPDAVPDCFEFSCKDRVDHARDTWRMGDVAAIVSSDAHTLSQIVPGRTALESSTPEWTGLQYALLSGNRQKVVVLEDMG